MPRLLTKRFGTRTLLVCVSVVCALMAFEVNRSKRLRDTMSKVRKAGGAVQFRERWAPIRKYLGPKIGNDYFREPSFVAFIGPEPPGTFAISCGVQGKFDPFYSMRRDESVDANPNPELFVALSHQRIHDLYLARVSIGDAHLRAISSIDSIVTLHLKELELEDVHALRHLSALPRLRTIDFTDTILTDEAIGYLLRCTGLRTLYLNDSNFSDTEILGLAELRSLEELYISNTGISQDAADKLMSMSPSLKKLVGASEPDSGSLEDLWPELDDEDIAFNASSEDIFGETKNVAEGDSHNE